jgi:hypothetical protein
MKAPVLTEVDIDRGSQESRTIYCAVLLPREMQIVCPDWDFVGANILCRLIGKTLASEGCIVGDAGGGGPLNDCLLTFDVNQPKRAAQLIMGDLEMCSILKFCEIAWWDDAELTFRHEYPERTNRPEFWCLDVLDAKLRAVALEVHRRINATRRLLKP